MSLDNISYLLGVHGDNHVVDRWQSSPGCLPTGMILLSLEYSRWLENRLLLYFLAAQTSSWFQVSHREQLKQVFAPWVLKWTSAVSKPCLGGSWDTGRESPWSWLVMRPKLVFPSFPPNLKWSSALLVFTVLVRGLLRALNRAQSLRTLCFRLRGGRGSVFFLGRVAPGRVSVAVLSSDLRFLVGRGWRVSWEWWWPAIEQNYILLLEKPNKRYDEKRKTKI